MTGIVCISLPRHHQFGRVFVRSGDVIFFQPSPNTTSICLGANIEALRWLLK